MKKHLLQLLFGSSLLLLAPSCGEEDAVEPDMTAESALAADIVFSTAEMDEIFRFVDEAFALNSDKRVAASFCCNVNLDLDNKTLTLDYGDGCTGKVAGIERKGKVTVAYTGTVLEPGSGSLGITFEDYEVNGTSINGTASATVVTEEGGGHSFQRSTDMTVIFSNGEQIVFDAELNYSWVEGAGDRESYNEVFEVSGTASGTSRVGDSYSVNITQAYVVKTSCFADGLYYPVSGVSDVTMPDASAFTIDFGTGTCDKLATITMGRFSKEIELP